MCMYLFDFISRINPYKVILPEHFVQKLHFLFWE